MIRSLALAVVVCTAQGALAGDLASSLRPVARGGNPVVQPVTVDQTGTIAQPVQDESQMTARTRNGLFSSLRPLFRTNKVSREGREKQALRAKGAVCGDPAIQGELVGLVESPKSGCGVENAVRVRAVAGVTLSQQAIMDCPTAAALKSWLETSAKPALSRKGGGLAQLRVAAHYACRTRNHQKGAKISEHGRGRAIDISGFQLANGAEITVLTHWNAAGFTEAMRRMHQGACGPFGTVLGPNADAFHRDHFHLDTARYRSGSYCK